MDAKGAEALRLYIESRGGGSEPPAGTLPVNGTTLEALERWFKIRDERTADTTEDNP
jgi:hypothetical protein